MLLTLEQLLTARYNIVKQDSSLKHLTIIYIHVDLIYELIYIMYSKLVLSHSGTILPFGFDRYLIKQI